MATDAVSGDDLTRSTLPVASLHRRRAARLYGLIISSSVLAAAPETLRTFRIGLLLLGTLTVYWIAETYVHWIAFRLVHGRDLTAPERREVLVDGVPLVAACSIPILVLFGEAVVGVDPAVAVDVALAVNTALLLVIGWGMSTAGGLRGWRRLVSTVVTGLLGVAMIALKTILH